MHKKSSIRISLIGALTAASLFSSDIVAQDTPGKRAPTYKESRDPARSRSGPREADPNIYVYNAEFAERFRMPEEWISTDLKGVDAVAFRVMPAYPTCGWGGDPEACRMDETRCEVDLYFDHQRHPLPWDDRAPQSWSRRYWSSVHFLPSGSRLAQLPAHSNLRAFPHSPFIESKTGKGLAWQSYYQGGGGGWLGLTNYERELFPDISLLTIGLSCLSPLASAWLTSEMLSATKIRDGDDPTVLAFSEWSDAEKAWIPYQGSTMSKLVILPRTWQERIRQVLKKRKDIDAAFFTKEGEKALNALREKPVLQKPLLPLQ